jgi:hypothetical protein
MKTNDPNFKAGYTARMSDLSQEANPFAFDAQPRRMWALGFQYADAKKEQAALNAEPLERVPAKPYEQGANAAKRGIDWRDCPYGSGDPHGSPEEQATNLAYTDWRRGHRDARQAKLKEAISEPQPTPGVNEHVADALDCRLAQPMSYQAFGRAFRKPNRNPLIIDFSNPKPAYMLRSEHDSRTSELLGVIDREVERRRMAERKLATIAEAVKGLDRDPNEV